MLPEEKQALQEAADLDADGDLSAWVRKVLLAAAARCSRKGKV
jgi:hypothetical protein